MEEDKVKPIRLSLHRRLNGMAAEARNRQRKGLEQQLSEIAMLLEMLEENLHLPKLEDHLIKISLPESPWEKRDPP